MVTATSFPNSRIVDSLVSVQSETQQRGVMTDTETITATITRQTHTRTSDGEGLTPLHLAAISGNLTALSVLVTNTPALLDALDNAGHSALHWAVVCGQAGCVRLLCERGAQAGLADTEGGTPLHYAAMADNILVLETLLEAGSDPGLEDRAGRTACSWAASSGGLSSFLCLVRRYPEALIRRDAQSLTPVHCAAARGHGEIIAASVGQGGDLEAEDSDGATPLFYAAKHGHIECVKTLVRCGANINKADKFGRTPLMCGVVSGKVSIVIMLSEAGADMESATRDGDTCLHLAVARRDHAIASWIVSRSPRIMNRANKAEVSPLHLVCNINEVKICKLLIDSNCILNPIYTLHTKKK